MNALGRAVPCLFALGLVVAGCASTQMVSVQPYEGGPIARPDRIIVHDFAATAADIPAGSEIAAQYPADAVQQTPEEIDAGRKLGAQVAKELVAEISSWGLPAVRAAGQPPPRIGDIVLTGYFASVDPGSLTKRLALGFGSGAAELKTVVEGYLMTSTGLRRLGGGEVESAGGKAPGVAVPLVVAAATGNPIGLIISSAAKVEGEASGRTTIEGAGKRTAKEIADRIKGFCQRQGWI